MNVPLKSPKEKLKQLSSLSSINGQYVLKQLIGQGSFGDIFEGYDKRNNTLVAVKVEKKSIAYPQLEYESKVYHLLHQPPLDISDIFPCSSDPTGYEDEYDCNSSLRFRHPPKKKPFVAVGIPAVYCFKNESDYNVMVMELCGPSLEDLFNYCHRRFSLKTVLMLSEQMLNRVEYIHERGLMHRDIKTDNFVFGTAKKSHILHLIDFGLSKLYWDNRRQVHISFVDGKPLTGTARYCSINAHRGYEQSRRDDLESIGYVLVYLLKGSLPWQGLQDQDRHFKSIKIGEKKIATSPEELCKGLPKEFLEYCRYCRNLSFQERPNYRYLRGLFRRLGKQMGYTCPRGWGATKGGMKSPQTELSELGKEEVKKNEKEKENGNSNENGNRNENENEGKSEGMVKENQDEKEKEGGDELTNMVGSSMPPMVNDSVLTNFVRDHSILGKVPGASLASSMKMANAPVFSPSESPMGQDPRSVGFESLERVEPQRRQGYYDWMFDWFDKRQREIRRGTDGDAS
ncbi:unnamed protein product [Phytomonas sp. EM1]|nr:unnamed protein product [Phytomonas sp. EM1]|eukprot:CCW64364.1 unnamed protein product [Phytomonas sp. isolate EM1]